MTDAKTDSSSTPLSDDPVIPIKGWLSAKPNTASHPAGAEPALDTLFHRTSLRFCCAPNVVTASVARDFPPLSLWRHGADRILGGRTGLVSVKEASREIGRRSRIVTHHTPPSGSKPFASSRP